MFLQTKFEKWFYLNQFYSFFSSSNSYFFKAEATMRKALKMSISEKGAGRIRFSFGKRKISTLSFCSKKNFRAFANSYFGLENSEFGLKTLRIFLLKDDQFIQIFSKWFAKSATLVFNISFTLLFQLVQYFFWSITTWLGGGQIKQLKNKIFPYSQLSQTVGLSKHCIGLHCKHSGHCYKNNENLSRSTHLSSVCLKVSDPVCPCIFPFVK